MSRLVVLTALSALALFGGGAGGLALAQAEAGKGLAAAPEIALSPTPTATIPAETLSSAPPHSDGSLRYVPGTPLTESLIGAGVGGLDAALADQALADVAILHGPPLLYWLGAALPGGARRLERLEAHAADGTRLVLTREGERFQLERRRRVAVNDTPVRLRLAGPAINEGLGGAGLPADVRHQVERLAGPLAPTSLDLIVAHEENGGAGHYGLPLYLAVTLPGGEVRRWLAGEEGSLEPLGDNFAVAGLKRPVPGPVSSTMGLRFHPVLRFLRWHRGTDFAAPTGTPVLAAAEGVVTDAGWRGGYGKRVKLAHPDGTITAYAHLARIEAEQGQRIAKGQVVGLVGATGLATGPHLHFEWLRNGQPLRPAFAENQQPIASLDGATLARLRSVLAAPYREPPTIRS